MPFACADAYFYYDAYPLEVEIFKPGHARIRGRTVRVPAHSGEFTVTVRAPGSPTETWRRADNTWITVNGGSGPQQEQRLLDDLSVSVKER